MIKMPQIAGVNPINILKTDARFSHHTLVVEKATHQLHLFENQKGAPHYLRSFKIATGKSTGDKLHTGDKKTPEGIYSFEIFLSQKQLEKRFNNKQKAAEYGAGAFTINYPNAMDLERGKTGGGIWLHSTDNDSRINKGLDSKGCVVVVDNDLKKLSQYIDLPNTTIIIVQDMLFMRQEVWQNYQKDLEALVSDWKTSWENEDLKSYLNYYHPKQFIGNKNSATFSSFSQYKKAVFSNPGKPKIELKNLSIFLHKEYALIQFEQHYESKTLPYEVGKKTLYLKKSDSYEWKIVAEKWSKLDRGKIVAFKPSSERYFED